MNLFCKVSLVAVLSLMMVAVSTVPQTAQAGQDLIIQPTDTFSVDVDMPLGGVIAFSAVVVDGPNVTVKLLDADNYARYSANTTYQAIWAMSQNDTQKVYISGNVPAGHYYVVVENVGNSLSSVMFDMTSHPDLTIPLVIVAAITLTAITTVIYVRYKRSSEQKARAWDRYTAHKTCPNCGDPVDPSAIECAKCGKKI